MCGGLSQAPPLVAHRWWIVDRLLRMNLFVLKRISGTHLINLYFRLMGAKIG